MPFQDHPSRRSDAGSSGGEDPSSPRVRFVGAGPGPRDLLTLRALRAIEAADVVVHDLLVHPDVLATAGATAALIPVAREPSAGGGDAGLETGRLLLEIARSGRNVVRLKGGDPAMFARLAEEMQPLREAGVGVEIIPGVTAAVAAAAAAAIPLTSRTHASAVTFVTGHQAGEQSASLELESIASLSGTIVFYMGVERLEDWSLRLVKGGRDGGTPVVIVSQCGWEQEKILVTSLASAAAEAARAGMVSPAVAIVGEVVADRSGQAVERSREPAGEPTADRPLAGRRILIARPEGQSEDLANRLSSLGGECLKAAAIRIEPPESWAPLDAAIMEAASFDWIVFSSTNGVESFVARLRAAGLDGRHLGTVRLAAVGAKTAAALASAGLVCDLVPAASYSAESLADVLAEGPPSGRFLLVKADRGRDVLARRLSAAGHEVREVVAYRSVDVPSVEQLLAESLDRRPADWLVLTSPAVAFSAIRLFADRLDATRIATISPLTSQAVRQSGREPTVEASAATMESIAGAIVAWEAAKPGRKA